MLAVIGTTVFCLWIAGLGAPRSQHSQSFSMLPSFDRGRDAGGGPLEWVCARDLVAYRPVPLEDAEDAPGGSHPVKDTDPATQIGSRPLAGAISKVEVDGVRLALGVSAEPVSPPEPIPPEKK